MGARSCSIWNLDVESSVLWCSVIEEYNVGVGQISAVDKSQQAGCLSARSQSGELMLSALGAEEVRCLLSGALSLSVVGEWIGEWLRSVNEEWTLGPTN